MRLAQSVRLGAWLLIGLNLLMALGAIGILMRMAPAIAGIRQTAINNTSTMYINLI